MVYKQSPAAPLRPYPSGLDAALATPSIAVNPSASIARAGLAGRLVGGAVSVGSAGMLGVGAWLRPDAAGHGSHTQLGLPPCAWASVFHRPCPTCGMTTAVSLAAHGRLVDAAIAQPFGLVVALAAAVPHGNPRQNPRQRAICSARRTTAKRPRQSGAGSLGPAPIQHTEAAPVSVRLLTFRGDYPSPDPRRPTSEAIEGGRHTPRRPAIHARITPKRRTRPEHNPRRPANQDDAETAFPVGRRSEAILAYSEAAGSVGSVGAAGLRPIFHAHAPRIAPPIASPQAWANLA